MELIYTLGFMLTMAVIMFLSPLIGSWSESRILSLKRWFEIRKLKKRAKL